MYYLRTRPKANAIQFTVDQDALKKTLDSKTKENVEPTKKPAKKVLRQNLKKTAAAKTEDIRPMLEYEGTSECLNCGS